MSFRSDYESDAESPITQVNSSVKVLRIILLIFLIVVVDFLLHGLLLSRMNAQAGQLDSIKRSSSAIAITSDGNMLLCVNPDSNTLTLIDTKKVASIAELGVGVDPRTITVDADNSRAYTANRGSDSITVVDLIHRVVITEISIGNRPYGIVVSPSGDRLYVAEQGQDQIRIIDTSNFNTIDVLSTQDRPSGLSISDDGKTLFVTHLLNPVLSSYTVSPNIIDSPTNIPLWPDSNLIQSVVLSPDGHYAYIPHTRSNSTNTALTFDTTVFPLVTPVDLLSGKIDVARNITLETVDGPVGLPFDLAFSPDDQKMWVLNSASNDISVVDLATGQGIAHIEVEGNPRGITLSPDGSTAYVNNTLVGKVSVINTATFSVTATIPVTEIPLPPLLLRGKRLFHSSNDPRMSRDQWISCNTCHFDGEHDGRTWFFGFAGPRNTTSLLGMIKTYPLRWSGDWDESADSEFAIRKENFASGLINGDMNCSFFPADCVGFSPNQGRSDDLDALAAYIDSLQIPLSPSHAQEQPLTHAEEQGRKIFLRPELGCASCHPPPLFTDHKKHDVGTSTAGEKIGPAYDSPSLMGLYDSAPYFHDGSAASLYDALTRSSPGGEHDTRGRLTGGELDDLINFLKALPYE